MKKTLGNKEKRELNEKIEKYGIEFTKKDFVQSGDGLIERDGEILFFNHEGLLVPSLKAVINYGANIRKITVDMGAVKFVVNGADIMRPGITEIEDGILENEAIAIIDENNKKALAIGIALFNSEEMKIQNSGKVIKNIHYVGDDIWSS